MKPDTVAVLDVGKTNKKVTLFDRAFNAVATERATIEPREHNGLEVEDTAALLAWFQDALKRLAGGYTVRAIATTTHGATGALLDADGTLAHPVISYTAAQADEVKDEFYQAFGSRDAIHRATCAPDLGFANLAKQFYYVKTRLPDVWSRVAHALFYDSYLAYELTGEMAIEPTYLGNHTCLWDHGANDWSAVARGLGADALFPRRTLSPWDSLGAVKPGIARACGLPEDCQVTPGIHDSNANFLPYLAQGHRDFVLNSTGTWCVLMTPSDRATLTGEEIEARGLFNLDARGKQVLTYIFPAGMEYDTFRGFTELPDETTPEAVREVVEAKDLFVVPGVMPDASAFPGATPRVVYGEQEATLDTLRAQSDRPMTGLGQAYNAALNLSLALATRRMLEHCGVGEGTRVFIEGGFANNRPYCELLATLCPRQRFALTSVKEGTSFGAALTGWMMVEGLGLDAIGNEFTIDTEDVPARDFGDLAAYEARFSKLVTS